MATSAIWKPPLTWWRLLGPRIRLCCRQAGLDLCNICVEILEAVSQLIGVNALRLPPELAALQLLDNAPELPDLGFGIDNLAIVLRVWISTEVGPC